jgi:hypothetical protein
MEEIIGCIDGWRIGACSVHGLVYRFLDILEEALYIRWLGTGLEWAGTAGCLFADQAVDMVFNQSLKVESAGLVVYSEARESGHARGA